MSNRRQFLHLGFAALSSCALPSPPSPNPNFNRFSSHTLAWSIRLGNSHHSSPASNQPFPWFSITKIFATLALTSQLSSQPRSIHTPLTDVFPEWRSDPRKSRICLSHLLTQTAGLPSGATPLYHKHLQSLGPSAIALPSIHPPGHTFTYGPACWEILGEFLSRSQSQPLAKILHPLTQKLHGPLHFTRTDEQGTPYLSTGIKASAATLSHLGQTLISLLLGRSSAGLDARIFLSLTQPSTPNPIFAGGLWLNRLAKQTSSQELDIEDALESSNSPNWPHSCLSHHQHTSLTTLIGSFGQRLYLLPDQKLSIARMGSSPAWNDSAFLRSF